MVVQFNERIKQLRERESLTQAQMAKILDITKSGYVKYERGEREPRYGVLVALSQYFDVTIDYLLGKSEEENPYISNVSRIGDVVQSDRFIKLHGSNSKSVQKMISDLIDIAFLAEFDDSYLDFLYVLVRIERQIFNIKSEGLHLFCYQKFAEGDPEYIEPVPKPTLDDVEAFLSHINEIRRTFDEFIQVLSSAEYYQSFRLWFEKEIADYSKVNREALVKEIQENPMYKSRQRLV